MKISIMFLLVAYLAIHFALSIALSNKSLDLLENLTYLNPPTDFEIIDEQLGELTFSWSSNLSEEIQSRFQVKYEFEYKYFDTDLWESGGRELVPEHQNTFELHRGVYLRIKNVLQINENEFRESKWTTKKIQLPGDPETLAYNFSCILYDHSNMTCRWYPGNNVPNGTQYKMYYRQYDTTRECAHYFTDLQGRQSCHTGKDMVDPEEDILICVNGPNNSSSIMPYYTKFDPQQFEKYNPPRNVEILPNLTVKWEKSPGNSVHRSSCFEYQLQLMELTGNNIKLFHVKADTKFILMNINLSKRYSVKVRTKLKYCKETRYWSDWSNEAFIEPKGMLKVRVMVFIFLLIIVGAGLLLRIIFRRYKIITFRPVPDPQKKFKELFEEYNGDFQKWLGYQIPISKYEECYTVVIEESIRPEAPVKKCTSSITTDLRAPQEYHVIHNKGIM